MKKTYQTPSFPPLFFIFLFLISVNVRSQNSCATAVGISVLPYASGSLSSCGNGNNYSGYGCGGYNGGEDYVFSYTPSTDTCISISLNVRAGTIRPFSFSVLDTCPYPGIPASHCVLSRDFNNTVTQTCSPVPCPASRTIIGTASLLAGRTYYIIVDPAAVNGAPTCFSDFRLTVSGDKCLPGEFCSNAVSIKRLPYSDLTTDNCSFSNNYSGDCLNGWNGGDKIYKYTPTVDQCVDVQALNTGNASPPGDFPYNVSVWEECPATGKCLASDKDSTNSGRDSAGIRNVNLTAGKDYYFVLKSNNSRECLGFDLHLYRCGSNPPGLCSSGSSNPPFITGNEKGSDCGVNLGFENADTTGWKASYNDNDPVNRHTRPPISPNLVGFNPSAGAINGVYGACGAMPLNNNAVRHTLTTGNVLDPNSDGQIPIVAPGGGNYSFRLGNHEAGWGSECIERTFIPDASKPIFTYAFAVVLEDPDGHTAAERPRFEITLSDSIGPLACGGVYIVTSSGRTQAGFVQANNPGCISGGSQIWYRKWSAVSVDLTDYIGKTINIKFCTADCGRGGHYGYAYVDAFCQSNKIQGATLCTTGDSTLLTAPPGFSNYSWFLGGDTIGKKPVGTGPTYKTPPTDSVVTVVFEQVGACCASKFMVTDTIRLLTNQVSGSATVCNTDTLDRIISVSSSDPRATYQWSPAAGLSCTTCQSPTVSLPLIQTTTYTVTTTSVNGCTLTNQVTLTMNNCGVNVVTNSKNICESICTDLTAIGTGGAPPYTYTWMPGGSTDSTLNVCPTTNTTYTVIVSDMNGATNSSVASVNISGAPVIKVTSDSICTGKTSILTAIGGISYTWAPAGGLSSTTGSVVSANPSSTTTYTVTGQNSLGCTNTTTAEVAIVPPPVITALPQSICRSDSAVITASGAVSYYWTPSNTLNYDTGRVVKASPASTTTYTVLGTSSVGCQATTTVTVTVNQQPTIRASDIDICVGGSGSLNATGGVTYTWTPSTGLSSSEGSPVTASPTASRNYTLTGTDANGCTNSDRVSVDVNPIPNITASSGPLCEGKSTTIQASGGSGSNYTWSPSTGLSSTVGSQVTASPTASTTYTVTGRSSAGCTNSAVVTLTITPGPVVSATGSTICAGNTATVSASGATTYTWNTGAQGSGVNVNPTTTTTYTVTGSENGCIGTATAVVNVDPAPSITASGDSICAGNSVSLSASGGLSYTWSPATGLNQTTGSSVIASPAGTITYTVVGINAGNCSNSALATVKVNPYPQVNLGNDTILCGNPLFSLNAGNPGAIYSWSTGAATSSILVTQLGTYWVSVTLNGCASTDTIHITSVPLVNTRTEEICIGDTLILDPGRDGVAYSWSTGQTSRTILIYKGGSYVVTTYTTPCNYTDSIVVNEKPGVPALVIVPNVFTPNNDNKNETFDIVGLDYASGYNIKIYDRWGLLMFESSDPLVDWKGTFKDKDVPQGVYYYILEYTNPCHGESAQKHGFLHVLR